MYADEGISGTSVNHRVQFLQMIQDAEDGKIDMIVTKSISRFARNTLDCMAVRINAISKHRTRCSDYEYSG